MKNVYTENIDKVKIAECNTVENIHKCNSCMLNIVLFQKSLQWTFELLLILFTTNTWIVKKKMLLDMIMSIKQKIIHIHGKNQTNKDQKSSILLF